MQRWLHYAEPGVSVRQSASGHVQIDRHPKHPRNDNLHRIFNDNKNQRTVYEESQKLNEVLTPCIRGKHGDNLIITCVLQSKMSYTASEYWAMGR